MCPSFIAKTTLALKVLSKESRMENILLLKGTRYQYQLSNFMFNGLVDYRYLLNKNTFILEPPGSKAEYG
jgi:hypothetical protein